MEWLDLTSLMTALGFLTLLTNLVVEVVKKAVPVPANIVAVVVALMLTLLAFFAWAAVTGLLIQWYHVAAAVVGGFLVAYAAMFGFDKLKETLERLGKM